MKTLLFSQVLKQASLMGMLILAYKSFFRFHYRNNRNEDKEYVSNDHMLRNHACSVANIQEIHDDRQQITVYRRLLWDDAKRALARPSFNPLIGLHIDFVEGAQDAGGPLCEFFFTSGVRFQSMVAFYGIRG